MSTDDIKTMLPFLAVLAAGVMIMMTTAFRRRHRLAALLAMGGPAAGLALLPVAAAQAPRQITPLLLIDHFGLFYAGLVFAATLVVAALSFSYLERHDLLREEFYLLLLTASLGAAILAVSAHFASFFLGLEILSVSLYALAAYHRHSVQSTEAGIKYLILAAVSSAFILFGMALVYGARGTLTFAGIASGAPDLLTGAGMALIAAGLAFKLALVPFHFWTPDVYEGAPAPVTAFIATVSKGAAFALALRLFGPSGQAMDGSLATIFTVAAVLSMFAGNLLALLQTNVKRILAYSSISHMGYLLVTLLAGGPFRWSASAFYLAAYFITSLGAFGVVTVLSTADRDADDMEDYVGLAWRRPWIAGIFTAMLLSFAGIPLTAGFVGKFYLAAAGIRSGLWTLVVILMMNSAIGLFYYLRIVTAVYSRPETSADGPGERSVSGAVVLAGLAGALLWLGAYPGPFLALIAKAVPALQ